MKKKIIDSITGLFTLLLILSSTLIIEYFIKIKDIKLFLLLLFELMVNIYAIKTIIKNIKFEEDDYKQNIFK